MARARFEYDADAFDAIIQKKGLTIKNVAQQADVSERHVHNILNRTTRLTRFRTKRKFQEAFEAMGVPKSESDGLFRKK